MGRPNDQQNPSQKEPETSPEIKDPPSDLPDYTDPQPPHPQDPVPPVIKSNNPYDPNDRLNYIREPELRDSGFRASDNFFMTHMRAPVPSEIPYRL